MKPTLTKYIKFCSWEQLCAIRNLANNEYNERKKLDFTTLSKRELDILRYFCYPLKEIAKKLIVSETTMQKHAFNILKKLEVNNRQQALIKAIRNGLISLNEVELP